MLENKIISSNKDSILRIVLLAFCVFFISMLVALSIIGQLYVASIALILCFAFLVCMYEFIKMIIVPLYYFNNLTQTILKNVPIDIAAFDSKGEITLISRQMSNLLSNEKDGLSRYLSELIKKNGSFEATREFEMSNGESCYFKIIKVDSIIYLSDVSEQMFLANADSLTNIANRRYFNERASIEFSNSLRDKSNLTFLMLDIDNFKKYNDTYGHFAGDNLLKEITEILNHITVRRTDLVGRFGGDEFVIMLHNTDLCGAKAIADKIRLAVENHGIVTISIGIYSAIPQRDEDFKMFLGKADKKLYEAKKLGRNKVRA